MDHAAKNVNQPLWCSRGMIVTVRGPGDAEVSVRVPRPFARIGSDRYAEVCLPQGKLLPCNLYLHATDSGIYCLGLSESAPHGWLTPHTRAEIGPYRIKAVFDDEGPAPVVGAADPRKKGLSATPAPLLKVCERSGRRQAVELAIDRTLTVVGRRAPCMFRMVHGTVSRVHCVLYWSGDALWAIDLLSANGTLLDRDAIDAAVWNAGQTLSLGDFRLCHGDTSEQRQPPQFLKLPAPQAALPAPSKPLAPRVRGRVPKWRSDVTEPPQSGPTHQLPAKRETRGTSLVRRRTGNESTPDDATRRETTIGDTPSDADATDLSRLGPSLLHAASGLEPCSAPALRLEQSAAPAVAAADSHAEIAPAGHEQRLAASKGSLLVDHAQSGLGTTEGERQLLQALRALAASIPAANSTEGELPPSLVQALLAMVQQAISQARQADQVAGDAISLPAAERRLAIAGDATESPARLLEQELSMVSLTLVKARQSAETGLAASQIDRLIGAIEGLDDHLVRLVAAGHDRPAASLEGPVSAMIASAAGLLESRSGEIRTLAAPTLTTDINAAAPQQRLAPQIDFVERAESPASPRTQPAQDRRTTDSLATDRHATDYQAAVERPKVNRESPAEAAPSSRLDDELLSRLMNFKTRQDSDIRRRKIVWTSAAAAAILLIIVGAGAAKLLFGGPAHDAQASEHAPPAFAEILK